MNIWMNEKSWKKTSLPRKENLYSNLNLEIQVQITNIQKKVFKGFEKKHFDNYHELNLK